MAISSILCLVFSLTIAGVSGQVQPLTDNNFERLTQASTGMTTGAWFVKFYAPWCGHCKGLAPIWKEVAEELKTELTVAEVDCTVDRMTCKRFGVRGYPTLILLKRGLQYRYKGSREKTNLIKFARTKGTDEDEDNDPGMVIPQPRSAAAQWIADQTSMLERDLAELWRFKKTAIAFTLIIGSTFGLVIGCLCGNGNAQRETKKQA